MGRALMITLQQKVHGAEPIENWTLKKLHHVLKVRKNNKNSGMKNKDLLSLSFGRIVNKNIETLGGLLPESFETYQIVEEGDVIMRLTDLQNDQRSIRQGIVKEKGIITSAYDAIYSGFDNDSRYWAYTLLSLDLAKYYYTLGGGVRQSIKFKDFPNDWICCPSHNDQKEIADFLDNETKRIDQLVVKKEELITSLELLANSVITENILQDNKNSRPSMHQEADKHPDYFWPNKIWPQLVPIKTLCIKTQSLSDKTNEKLEISYIDIGNVSFAKGITGFTKYQFGDAPSRARQIVKNGDVIISTVRTYLKSFAFIENNIESNLICSTGFCVLRANKKVYPKYLYRAVR